MSLSVCGFLVLVLTTVGWFRLAKRVAIPDNRALFVSLWGASALLGFTSFFVSGSNWITSIFAGLAILGGAGLLVLYLLRKQGVGQPISVGDAIPDFLATDDAGSTFNSSTTSGSPQLIKFFRGHW